MTSQTKQNPNVPAVTSSRWLGEWFHDWTILTDRCRNGILWETVVINDVEYVRMAEGASKEFLNSISHRTEILSCSPEDAQAIQSYCLGDFRYHCFALSANNHLEPSLSGLTPDEKLNLSIVKQEGFFGVVSYWFVRAIRSVSFLNPALRSAQIVMYRVADGISRITGESFGQSVDDYLHKREKGNKTRLARLRIEWPRAGYLETARPQGLLRSPIVTTSGILAYPTEVLSDRILIHGNDMSLCSPNAAGERRGGFTSADGGE